MPWTSLADLPDQSGRVAIVTGANSGIGFETVRHLATKGAHVVLACRNQAKGQTALDALKAALPDAALELMALDLSNLASVKAFAEAFAAKHDRLDLLINNAGVMMTPQSKTADGFELQFGTNHLGHFALTGHLLGLIEKTAGARVVNVSSMAHRGGTIDFDNLNAEKRYGKLRAYGQSKLANLLFTRELQRRFADKGISATAVAAHPGWTRTNLQNTVRTFKVMNPVFAMKPPQGALPTVYAATAVDVPGGGYIGPQGVMEMRGNPGPAKISKRAQDDAVAARLWDVSQDLTGVRYLG